VTIVPKPDLSTTDSYFNYTVTDGAGNSSVPQVVSNNGLDIAARVISFILGTTSTTTIINSHTVVGERASVVSPVVYGSSQVVSYGNLTSPRETEAIYSSPQADRQTGTPISNYRQNRVFTTAFTNLPAMVPLEIPRSVQKKVPSFSGESVPNKIEQTKGDENTSSKSVDSDMGAANEEIDNLSEQLIIIQAFLFRSSSFPKDMIQSADLRAEISIPRAYDKTDVAFASKLPFSSGSSKEKSRFIRPMNLWVFVIPNRINLKEKIKKGTENG
jgi:hypothetical protein